MSTPVGGFQHDIAVGPTTLQPTLWPPQIWGTEEMIIAGLELAPRAIEARLEPETLPGGPGGEQA